MGAKMANNCSDYSNTCVCWTIREGPVHVITENHAPLTRCILKAKCGIIDGWDARLECYKDVNSANVEKPIMWRMFFTDVEEVHYIERRQKAAVILMHMKKGNKIIFSADSDPSTKKWYNFCALLYKIPLYAIPEMPEENVALQQGIIQLQYNDRDNNWVVHILNEGIGCAKRISGLCVVSISDVSSTFNIHDFHNGKCLLSWHRDDIGLSGYVNSLIFVEAKKTQCGGPGLLWMQYPIPLSATLHKDIHEFLYARPKDRKTPSPVSYVFVDSAKSHAHIKDDTDQELSQTPYEDQLSASLSSVVACSPVSQSPSLSSASSQCSSGYYSDSSYSESVSSKSSQLQLSHTKVMPDKYVGSHNSSTSLKKHSAASLPIEATSPTTSNNSHICLSSSSTTVKRKFSNTHKISSTVQHHSTNPQHHPSTKNTRIPRPRLTSNQYAFNSCHLLTSITDPISSSSSVSKQQLEEKVLHKCSVKVHDNLDISIITPQLMIQEMLTKKDHQTLLNPFTTDVYKVDYLLYILPRKGEGFLRKFIHCLNETKDNTGHGDIVKALKATYKESKKADLTE